MIARIARGKNQGLRNVDPRWNVDLCKPILCFPCVSITTSNIRAAPYVSEMGRVDSTAYQGRVVGYRSAMYTGKKFHARKPESKLYGVELRENGLDDSIQMNPTMRN